MRTSGSLPCSVGLLPAFGPAVFLELSGYIRRESGYNQVLPLSSGCLPLGRV
jgi:hypothetical protein